MGGAAWHALSVEEVFKALKSSPEGLSWDEVRRRLEEYGPNEIREERRVRPLTVLLRQFESPLVIILLFATALSLVIGEVWDAATIVAIVIASAALGFFQEYRAERALEALRKMAAPQATVVREGREVTVPARELVPGDVLVLRAGDRVPADARLFEVVNLKVDESSLTGESVPVTKRLGVLPPETPLPDRANMVYAGTVVTYGKGKAVVVATGMSTELGRIAARLQEEKEGKTPLERRMEYVGRILAVLCLTVAAFVAAIGLFVWRYDPLTMIMWAISLAVAAVPEALPAVVTGALAIGMYRMARRNAIVRRLPAVETLGSTTFICSDKTGTMTKGEMTVRVVYAGGRRFEVTGVGYEPKGEFLLNGRRINPLEFRELKLLLLGCALNNDARLVREDGAWVVKGDTTEGALLVLAAKAGLDRAREEYPRVGEVPFSSERKRMTTVHRSPEGRMLAFLKGAPEVVVRLCESILEDGEARPITNEDVETVKRLSEEMASNGLRVLALAYKEVEEGEVRGEVSEEFEKGFTFLGLVGMIDPPRPEVKRALELCKRAGIKVSMVTGDHKLTAVAIARELGLYSNGDLVLTGAELDGMSDEDLERVVERVRVYARVSPEHKLRIVKALKRRGHVVAMTGDGVNDAPALKAADIGVAMGIKGTEVAKEASDMILADDNFATIVEAVKQGREIFDNIRKYLAYLLRCNIAEILVPLIASLAKLPLPLTAIQYLWINLTTDGLPALALGVDPADPDVMDRPPRRLEEGVFSRREAMSFLIVTPLVMAGLLVFLFGITLPAEGLVRARTLVFTTMILTELVLALSCRSLRHPLWRVGVFKNKFLIAAIASSLAMQLAVLYTPALHSVFDVEAPSLGDWGRALAVALAVFALMEGLKLIPEKKSR